MAKKITVAKAFTFTHPDGRKQHFHVGVHKDVPDKVTEHWYTKAHLDTEDGGDDSKPPEASKGKGGKKADDSKPPEGNKQ